MRLGTGMRLGVLIAFLALYGHHALGHALPGLGLVERRDLAAIIAVQDWRTLRYRLVNAHRHPVGEVVVSFSREDQFVRIDTQMRINDPDALPGLQLVAAQLRPWLPQTAVASEAAPIDLTTSQQLDEHLRLSGLGAHGWVLGYAVQAQTRPTAGRWSGTWQFAHQAPLPLTLAGITTEEFAGIGLGAAMPPRLKPGERFRQRIITPDPTASLAGGALHLHGEDLLAQVGDYERVPTAQGHALLLRVDLLSGTRPHSTVWCADDGTIHRLVFAGLTLAMELTRITDQEGTTLWPPPR